ncbi:hypothetical protein ACQP1G_37050 [Nocardia sp. CA-107356]|uniref:hypothetical protein n=1 Tax=Nocardia sp. CA-107356 TaxID=3239972 RepID=UPI003D8B382C
MSMWHIRPFERLRRRSVFDATALMARAEQTRLVPVGEANAVVRPTSVSDTYLETEYDQLGVEQLREHAAAGEQAARKSAVRATGLDIAREARRKLIEANEQLVTIAGDHYSNVKKLLGPFASRKAGSGMRYLIFLVAFLCGDSVGLLGAFIQYGEIPMLAACQAVSAGAATVTAGMVGAEAKNVKLAAERQLDPDALSEELAPYRALLVGPLAARKFVMAATAVATLIALAVAVGICALRSSIEGQTSGFVFGGLAIAIACGSWVNSYLHADAVADKVELAYKDYRRELRAHGWRSRSWRFARSERAAERARLIRQQHEMHGEAANAKVMAAKHRAMQQSPDVIGHGPAASADIEIGRKPRPRSTNRGKA